MDTRHTVVDDGNVLVRNDVEGSGYFEDFV